MAYAATLFYSYFASLCVFLLTYSLLERKKQLIKRSVIVIITIVATNSFWLLPSIFTLTRQSEEIRNSTINKLFSPEAFLYNKSYGNLKDVVIHKNHLFSWREHDAKE